MEENFNDCHPSSHQKEVNSNSLCKDSQIPVILSHEDSFDISIDKSGIHQIDDQISSTSSKPLQNSIINEYFPPFHHVHSKCLFSNDKEENEFLKNQAKLIPSIRNKIIKRDSSHWEYLKKKKEWCEKELQKELEKETKEIKDI